MEIKFWLGGWRYLYSGGCVIINVNGGLNMVVSLSFDVIDFWKRLRYGI